MHETDKVVNFHPASLKHLVLLSFPYPLFHLTVVFFSLKPTSHYSLLIPHCRNITAVESAENKIQWSTEWPLYQNHQDHGPSQKMRYKDCKRQFGEEQPETLSSGHKRTIAFLKSHQLFLAQDQDSQHSFRYGGRRELLLLAQELFPVKGFQERDS